MTAIDTLQARYGPDLADLILSKACANLLEDTGCATVGEAHDKYPSAQLEVGRALRDIEREASARLADISR